MTAVHGEEFYQGVQGHEGEGYDTHGHGEGGHGHQKINEETGIAPRRCTNMFCCFLFLIMLIILIALAATANTRGDTARLTRGTDYYGRICGVDAGVENMPWLFWCRSDPTTTGTPSSIYLQAPTCVATCPTADTTASIACLQEPKTESANIPGGQLGNVETQQIKMQESIVATAPYETTPRGGRFCMPVDEGLSNSVKESPDALAPGSQMRWRVALGTLGHLWWIFLVVMVVTIIFCYLYYGAMQYCPKYFTWIFLIPGMIVLGLLAFLCFLSIFVLLGRYWPLGAWVWEHNPIYDYFTWVWGSLISILIGILLLSAAMALGAIAWHFDGYGVADLLNAARECKRTVGLSLYLQPLLAALWKFLFWWIMLMGVRGLASIGWTEKNRIHVNEVNYAGLSRAWYHDDWALVMMAVWILGMLWIIEITTAFGQFLVSYAAVCYFYSPKHGDKKESPGCTMATGTKYALLYHFGSLASVAARAPWFRPMHFLYWATHWQQKMCKWCACLCNVCPACGDPDANYWYIKDGLNDVYIRSNEAEGGAAKAKELYASHAVVQHLKNNITQMTLSIFGIASISTTAAAIAYAFVRLLPIYTDPSSSLYVADPLMVTVLSWVFSALIAFDFMTVWDHLCDALLYCYVWTRFRKRPAVDKYIPRTLRDIVGFDDREADRYPYYGRAKTNMYLRSWIPIGQDKRAQAEANAVSTDREEGIRATGMRTGWGFGTQQGMGTGYNPEAQPLMR